jgi:hypothetical protein
MTRIGEQKRAAARLVIALFWIGSRAAESCTLWAAVGEATRGGGSLVVKNRDWRPDHRQEIKRVTPKQGFRYFGLFATGNDEPGLKAGVNEKGLVVVSATAPYWRRELKAIRCLFVWPTPEKTSAKSVSRVRIFSGGRGTPAPREALTIFSPRTDLLDLRCRRRVRFVAVTSPGSARDA